MTCEPNSIQCSINDLGHTLTSFNANDLLATAIATVAGVLFGAFLTRLAARREEKRARLLRDEERLNVALGRLIWEINDHSVALRRAWERQQAPESAPEWLPPDYGILAAIAAARMVATSEDEKAVLDGIRQLALEVRLVEIDKRVESLTLVWRTLILWREGMARDKVLKSIDELRPSIPES